MEMLIVFPAFEALQREIEKLRTELSMLMLELDELRYVECKNIETAYMLELGGLEYKAFEAQCAYLRLKRKLELIQARLNRQESVDTKEIEKRLDAEFAAYQEQLNAQIEKMNEAIDRSRMKTLSEEETKELKGLYRKIVKALHPDLHPDGTPEQVDLFRRAVDAYKDGNLFTLRIIAEMAADPALPAERADDSLTRERDRLKALVQEIRRQIADVKSQYPYTLKDLVLDKEKTALRRKELEEILEQYRRLTDLYRERIQELLSGPWTI